MDKIKKIQELLTTLFEQTEISYQFSLKTECDTNGIETDYEIFFYRDNNSFQKPTIEYYKNIDHVIERLEFLIKTA